MSNFSNLLFEEAQGKLLARYQPVPERVRLDRDTLLQLLDEAGYRDWLLHEDAVASLLERCNSSDAAFELTLGERCDASFTIEIAKDAMCAWVDWIPAQAGKGVTAQEIVQALGDAGVTFGLDQAALHQACSADVPVRVVAAAGVAPVQGEDTRFEMLVDLVRDRSPKVNAQGLIDFRELGDIPMVEAGVALMRRIPATQGVEGHDVFGTVLAAGPGQEHPFADKLVGVAIAAEDPNLLCAAVKGQPVSLERGASVEQVLSLKSVDMSSGNISFDGSVKVDGDVIAGMKVKATGDILVAGLVEGAELEADGNIQVAGGIIAHAKVRAAGAVSVRFVENAQIYAGTAIAVADMAMQSDLQALNQIVIGVKSPDRGRLIGGSARAMLLVRVPQLGAATSGVTNVQVGVNPVLEAKHQELLELIAKQDAEQDNLKKVVHHLTQHGDKNGLLERARTSWKRAVQAWAQSLQEKEALEQELSLVDGAQLEVDAGVAGSVDLVLGKQTRHLRSTFGAGMFSLDEQGRVIFTGASGDTAVVT